MKKLFTFFALLAGIAVMTGCQKEQDFVTLKAVIDQDTKAYFGDAAHRLPYWNANDKVQVAGEGAINAQSTGGFFSTSRRLDAQSDYTTTATISGVPARSVYCAIYPSNIVDKIGSPSTSGTSATIYYKPTQEYIENNGIQQVNMPMGAITTATNKMLIFKNLCSILRVNVTNALADVDFNVRKITVQTYGAYLAGYANVTLFETTNPQIRMNSVQNSPNNNVLSFFRSGYESMGTISHTSTATNHSKSFDIVVPPFDNASELVIEVELYNDDDDSPLGYFEYTVDNPPAVAQNNIYPIDLNVDRYTTYDYAYFLPGPAFNKAIRGLSGINNITGISFTNSEGAIRDIEACSTNYTYTTVHAANSPLPIYAYIESSSPYTLVINSRATFMYCDTNCSYMFANLPWTGVANLGNLNNLQSIWWNNVTTTGLPCGFQTEDVTDMSYMFAGCASLTGFYGIENFNTTNVRNMEHMFEGCSAMNGWNQTFFTYFNTRNLKKMGAMFKDCTGLQTLNISTFNTEHVTDMKELFYNCNLLQSLNINSFVISNNTNIDDMCYHLNYGQINNINQYSGVANTLSYITCDDDTWRTIKGEAENNNPPIDPTTKLDLRLVAKSPGTTPTSK